jgi:hypothetical protein
VATPRICSAMDRVAVRPVTSKFPRVATAAAAIALLVRKDVGGLDVAVAQCALRQVCHCLAQLERHAAHWSTEMRASDEVQACISRYCFRSPCFA